MIERIDTVVVGGGQAGLAMSHHLTRMAREHVVIERGQVAQSWRSERWDSLMFQFPNWSIQLPGYSYDTDEPDAFAPKDELVRFMEHYAALIDAPLRCGVRVVAVRQAPGSDRLLVDTEQGTLELSTSSSLPARFTRRSFHRSAPRSQRTYFSFTRGIIGTLANCRPGRC